MREGKDPDPYLCLMDPDPGGQKVRLRIPNTKVALTPVFAPSPQSNRYGELFYRDHAVALTLSARSPSTVGAIGIAAGRFLANLSCLKYSGRTKYSVFVSKLNKLSEEYLSPQETQKAAVFFIGKILGSRLI